MAWKQYALGTLQQLVISNAGTVCWPGGAILKQFSFKQAMGHEHMVCEVAYNALGGGRSTQLAVHFDEVVRQAGRAKLRCNRT